MSNETHEPVWKVVPSSAPNLEPEVIEFVEKIINGPEFKQRGEEAFREEWRRQIGYGLPPSEGLPDIRGAFPVYPHKPDEENSF